MLFRNFQLLFSLFLHFFSNDVVNRDMSLSVCAPMDKQSSLCIYFFVLVQLVLNLFC